METSMRNNRGQAALELLLLTPLLAICALVIVQLSQLFAAGMATAWAARHAARSAAVHWHEAEPVARAVAVRTLGPFLRPGVDEAARDLPVWLRWTARAAQEEALGREVQVAAELRVYADEWTPISPHDLASLQGQAARGEVVVTVHFDYRLRLPLANRILGVGGPAPMTRSLNSTARFPVIYGP
jgi:hypothetical protein